MPREFPLALTDRVTTGSNGEYSLPALPAGTYRLTVTRDGFRTAVFDNLEVTLNRTLRYDVHLDIGSSHEQVEVSGDLPLLETQSSAESTTIMPQEIENMPLNGRNYLDLLQLVPGVAINRQADANSDNATPILGERANNTGFLIDGLPNENELGGGPASQFNQDTIAEFQVITTGYKAEFGHSSGGVVNVITKSGSNDLHGLASVYHRNSVFDSSDISGQSAATGIPGQSDPPYLLRWDYDAAAGGAMVRDKAFWFASAEGIHENRQLNFVPPPNTPQFLLNTEEAFNRPTTDREVRAFAKFDQVLGRHHFTEQMNYTNVHVNSTNPLSASINLPSTRTNLGRPQPSSRLQRHGYLWRLRQSVHPQSPWAISRRANTHQRRPPGGRPQHYLQPIQRLRHRRHLRRSRTVQLRCHAHTIHPGTEIRHFRRQSGQDDQSPYD